VKSIVLIFLYCASWSLGFGQNTEQVKVSDLSLKSYLSAVISSDYPRVASMTHPRIVDLAGGEDFLISQMEEEKKMYNDMNLRLINITTGATSPIVAAGPELHALIPYTAEYDNGGSVYIEKNYYLASSLDGGSLWYFLDFKKYDVESIKAFLPEYNSRLDAYLNEDSPR
jgi:hypothetical protein